VPAPAEIENDNIGFSSNHVFDGAINGENVDILNGNVNLRIPIGPRYKLNDWFGYQVQLYYNSKIWRNVCDGTTTPECPGHLASSSRYGAGFSLHFGRIYRNVEDLPFIFRYQTSDGSEHLFCNDNATGLDDCNFVGKRTIDASAMKIDRSGSGWVAYPGDGTRLVFAHQVNGGIYDPKTDHPEGGWYVTSIETLDVSQQWVHVAYTWNTDQILTITDKAGRVISFPSDGVIRLPSFADSDVGVSSETADYTLLYGYASVDDPAEGEAFQSVKLLQELRAPELDAAAGEKYTFEYNFAGYLRSWTLPTGAAVDYHYNHYRSSDKHPLHSEVSAKVLRTGGEEHRWTYARFGDANLSWEEFLAMEAGKFYSGSNPRTVQVVDPFGNLTVYSFGWTPYTDSGENCDAFGCPNYWTDGLLYSVKTYAGAEALSSRLVRKETREYTYDDRYLQFKENPPYAAYSSFNQMGVHVRPSATTVVTHGGGEFPTSTRSIVYQDWTNTDSNGEPIVGAAPRAREVLEYDGQQLYRRTFTDWETDWASTGFVHDAHRYVEVTDSTGVVVSRTDRKFLNNRVLCEVERNTGSPGEEISDCGEVVPAVGDVLTLNEYDVATGSLISRSVSEGDDGLVASAAVYAFKMGTLETKEQGDIGWYAADRDVDFNTGLVRSSRDPSLHATDYSWDKLNRLTQIVPALPETPVTIDYVSIHETRVRQEGPAGDYAESTFLYDDLGRLREERRRNLDAAHPFDFRRFEYDVAGRVVRQSEWARQGTADAALFWTTHEYRSSIPNPDVPGEYFVDPLGRVSKVTRPDDGWTATQYEGLATRVTVHGIQGVSDVELDATTVYVNDAFGRLVQVHTLVDEEEPAAHIGADATYLYDELDRLVEVQLVDPDSPPGEEAQIRRFTYDQLGRLRAATNPESGTVEYLSYDAAGRLLEWVEARGNRFRNTYDAAGRVTLRHLMLGEAMQPMVTNFYDAPGAAGKLSAQSSYRATGGAHVATTTYNYTEDDCPDTTLTQGLNGRLAYTETTIEPWAESLKTEYCYDVMGLESLVAYPPLVDAQTVVRSTHTNGILWAVDDWGRNYPYIQDVEYGPHGSPIRITRGNNNVVTDFIDRDSQGRPTEFRVKVPDPPSSSGAGRPPLELVWGCGQNNAGIIELDTCIELPDPDVVVWESRPYHYDLAGNIKQIGPDIFWYDELNRLVHATTTSTSDPDIYASEWFSYDVFGNMLYRTDVSPEGKAQSFIVNRSTNRLVGQVLNGLSYTGYTYDASGNMTIAGNRAYVVDAANRLSEVWSGDPAGPVARYDYDAGGYRVHGISDDTESFYVRDGAGRLLSEYRRAEGATDAPGWNKDYIYGLGQTLTMLKNTIPEAPGRPWATGVGAAGLTLNWNGVDENDVPRYRVYRSVNGVPDAVPAYFGPNLSVWNSFAGLRLKNTDFVTYTVRAVDSAANESTDSPVLVVRPLSSEPPAVPSGLVGIELDRAVSLTWGPVSDDDLWGYYVEAVGPWNGSAPDPTDWEAVNDMPLPQAAFLDFNLVNGQYYKYRVRAVDTAGHSSAPSTEEILLMPHDPVPPARPSAVQARPGLAPGTLVVKWAPVLDPDLAGYVIERGGVLLDVPGATAPVAVSPGGSGAIAGGGHGDPANAYDGDAGTTAAAQVEPSGGAKTTEWTLSGTEQDVTGYWRVTHRLEGLPNESWQGLYWSDDNGATLTQFAQSQLGPLVVSRSPLIKGDRDNSRGKRLTLRATALPTSTYWASVDPTGDADGGEARQWQNRADARDDDPETKSTAQPIHGPINHDDAASTWSWASASGTRTGYIHVEDAMITHRDLQEGKHATIEFYYSTNAGQGWTLFATYSSEPGDPLRDFDTPPGALVAIDISKLRVRAVAAGDAQGVLPHTFDAEIADFSFRDASDPKGIVAEIEWVENQPTGGLATTYLDWDLDGDLAHTYTVRALDTSGNTSPPSDPATAVPRDADIEAPQLQSVRFEVDYSGTEGGPSTGSCDTISENDDLLGVALEWLPVDAQNIYRIYRAEGAGDDYALLAELSEASVCQGSPLSCTYFDSNLGGDTYTYFVVAVGSGPSGHEGAAQQPWTAVDAFDTSVRNVIAIDGRLLFDTDNERARAVQVQWSPLLESTLQGYHVYRRCDWECWFFGKALRDLSCVHSWVRLTEVPAVDSVFIDWQTGDLRGCYNYAVRPVAADGTEGPIQKIVYADLNNQGLDGEGMPQMHCEEPVLLHDIFSKLQIVGTDADRINALSRGSESPVGLPAAPVLVDRNAPACWCYVPPIGWNAGEICDNPPACLAPSCPCPGSYCCPLPDQANARAEAWDDPPSNTLEGLYAYVDWLPNQESDIAGYYVEMAGSTAGPWRRVTPQPLAWWETHYDARLWAKDYFDEIPGSDWVGPNCAVFRVLAVDENGNESGPSEAFQVAPVPEVYQSLGSAMVPEVDCSASTPVLPAPQNLVAESVDIGYGTRLTWSRVAGAAEYRVYRLVLWYYDHQFYLTGIVPQCGTATCEFVEEGDWACPFKGGPNSSQCELGFLDAFYVTAVEATDPENPDVMPRESHRSNIVRWHPNKGYVRNEEQEPEAWDALALLDTQQEGPLAWCEEPPGEPGLAVAVAEGEPSRNQERSGPAVAPLLRLGQTGPAFEILDLHVDHLGSTRVVTNDAGAIVTRHDFMPFGEELAPVFDYNTKMFTGHERDEETGLDYMLARYYSDSLGRFLNVDPGRAGTRIPQTWNRYTYALNGPVMHLDSAGREAYPFYEKDPALGGIVPHSGMVVRDPSSGDYLAYDFSPTGGATALPTSGFVRSRSGGTAEEAIGQEFTLGEMIATSPAEDQALIDWWESLANDPGTYSWVGRNCITVCVDAMEAVLPGYWMLLEGFYSGWSWPGINASIRHSNQKRRDDALADWIKEHGFDKLIEWDLYYHELRVPQWWQKPTGPPPPNRQ